MKRRVEEYIDQKIKVEEFTLYNDIRIEDYIQKEIKVEDTRANG